MNDDSRVIDKGWDALPDYASKSGDADDAVTVSISTTPGEWLVNTVDAVVVPMSMAELVEGLRAHKLTERSLVWRAGMQEWAPVDAVPQLKLAARIPIGVAPSTVPPRPSPASVAPSKPPPKPIRASTPAPHPVPPQTMPSRRSTLPFGLTPPIATASRASSPHNVRPASSPRNAAPPPRSEEPEVLAVYERPAATVSFDLSPAESLRAPTPSRPPETLAPITTDSARRRIPLPRNADLSVVAASDFRQVQRSSKRLVWTSSLASAAAASLLTFWLAHSPATAHSGAAAAPAEALATALPIVPATPPAAAPPAAAPPTSAAAAAPAAPTPSEAPAKPKPSHKSKAVSAVAAQRPTHVADTAHTTDPGADPNPYDVKLDEEAPAKAVPATPHGSGLEADDKAPKDAKDTEASTSSGSTSPGF